MPTESSRGPASRVCANHPDRSARAICMSCRKAVCGECATEWDGINYCVTCLAARGKVKGARSNAMGWGALAVTAALLFWLNLRLMVWTAVLVAGLW